MKLFVADWSVNKNTFGGISSWNYRLGVHEWEIIKKLKTNFQKWNVSWMLYL